MVCPSGLALVGPVLLPGLEYVGSRERDRRRAIRNAAFDRLGCNGVLGGTRLAAQASTGAYQHHDPGRASRIERSSASSDATRRSTAQRPASSIAPRAAVLRSA
jgi:hypothetical protein